MVEEQFSARPVNFQGLDAELRSNLGSAYTGLMVSDSMIRVFLNEGVNRATVQALLDAHDPQALTPEQAAEDARQAALAAGRETYSSPLESEDFSNESLAVQALAARFAWLELEVRALRGL